MPGKLSSSARARLARKALDNAPANPDVTLSLDELELLDQEHLDAYLRILGIEIDWARLESNIRQDLGSLGHSLDSDALLDEHATKRLEEQVAKSVEKTARAVTRETIRQETRAAWEDEDPRPQQERAYVWVSVGSGQCDSCVARHGVIDTMDAWDGNGPGDGGTLCADKCRCRLLPTDLEAGREGLKALSAAA